jgi:hypothetical protein
MQNFIEKTAYAIVGLILAILFAFMLLNWASGCGESYVTADGSRIQGECITPVTILRGGV